MSIFVLLSRGGSRRSGGAVFLISALAAFSLILALAVTANAAPDYVCGDADGNGFVSVSDAVYLIAFIFAGGPAPEPLLAGDCDLNEIVNVADAVYLVAYVFGSGPDPCSPLSGALIIWNGCKFMERGNHTDTTPPTQDCIEWQYDGESILLLKHVNAAFNCCPDEILADIAFVGNAITIQEAEYCSMPCDCLCLFDVDYQITNLIPGDYIITVVGMYLSGADPMEITVNLTASPTGSFCIERHDYPWGMW